MNQPTRLGPVAFVEGSHLPFWLPYQWDTPFLRGKGPLWNRMRQETKSYVLKQGMDLMCDLNLSWGRELRKGEK